MKPRESSNYLELFKRNETVYVYLSKDEDSAVQIATKNLIRDINWVCACNAVISENINQCNVIIGTLGNNDTIDNVVRDKKLSVDKLKADDNSSFKVGSYRWEAFIQEVAHDAFYIIGTNRRGTIYGIYELCQDMGVSPWYYWADVPVKTKDVYSVAKNHIKVDWPSVKYRGVFINDEEELENWAKLHTPDGTIGPTTYERVFELLLRLKANYIWPAMHVNYFNGNPDNGALADRMGIVVGTSHCDMMLRSNQNEWQPWIASKGYNDAVYDYSIEGRNREILKEYWRESVEQNKNYEVSYTMGMRGIHDSGFHTKAIDEDASLSEEEKWDAKVALLSQVIKDQRQILKEVLGEEKASEMVQTFIPYKEVLDLYDRGLDIPEEVTLIWANDNYGHVRRYPDEEERKRPGGNGLYYHCSYWAPPGKAMSYLFINSIPLAQIANELRKSYESGIRHLWILNIGGLKPVEQDMEFFIRYGWEAGKEAGITKDTLEYTKHWINSNFTGNHGEEVARLYETFAQVTNVRKIEHMNNKVFSQTAYGDEAGRRLQRLEDIYRRGNQILYSLPEEERVAFFQLFLMKIHASYYTNHEYYYADRSILSYDRGNMQAADRYTQLSVKMMNHKRRMLHFYNKKMSGGKWDGMLTPELAPPPATAMYPVRKPALKIVGSGLRVDCWNEEDSLSFSLYGQRQKWIELGNQGEGSIPYSIEIKKGADWISLSEYQGILQTDKRILVSVADPYKNAGLDGLIVINDERNNASYSIKVSIEEEFNLPGDFNGYIEADGYISIPAANYHKIVPAANLETQDKNCTWLTIPGLGRYEGAAMMAWNPDLLSLDTDIKANPYLEYNIYLKRAGIFDLEIYRFLTLNSKGRIRLALAIDDMEPIIVESETIDEWKGNWQESIFNNGERILLSLPHLSAGAHSLKIYMIDNYVTISKLVIYTLSKKVSNLGPATSMSIHNAIASNPTDQYGIEYPRVDWDGIEHISCNFYRTKEEEVPAPRALYASKKFFENIHDQVYNPCENYPQALGAKRYDNFWKATGHKDLINEFGSGIFEEKDGVVAIEAEYALENSENAYLSASKDGRNLYWTHLQAETNGRTGFAMHVAEPDILWENPDHAPAMHYRINIHNSDNYHIWLLLRHYNSKSDSCYIGLDGKVMPLAEQFGKGKLITYNTEQVYYWCHLADLEISSGEHIFSIIARKSQLRIDRIYLTRGDELPPKDDQWQDCRYNPNL